MSQISLFHSQIQIKDLEKIEKHLILQDSKFILFPIDMIVFFRLHPKKPKHLHAQFNMKDEAFDDCRNIIENREIYRKERIFIQNFKFHSNAKLTSKTSKKLLLQYFLFRI